MTTFGLIIDNALLERDEAGEGSSQRSVQRYTLPQLLDERFKLPRGEPTLDVKQLRSTTDGGLFVEEVR